MSKTSLGSESTMVPRLKARWLAVTLVGLTGCFSTCPTDPLGCLNAVLSLQSGGDAFVLEGTAAPDAVVISVAEACANENGPLSGLELLILFSSIASPTSAGGPAAAPPSEIRVKTDAEGKVTISNWVLARGENTITASIVGSDRKAAPINVTGTGVPGNGVTLTPSATDLTPVVVGGSVSTPSVTASYQGRGVSGVPFEFRAIDPQDRITNSVDTTGTDGKAQPGGWTVGNRAGVHVLTATPTNPVVTAAPITYRVQVNPGPAANAIKIAGDNQRVAAGSAVPIPPRIRVTDQHQNPVPNVNVQFAVGPTGGTVTGPSQTTDSAGEASPASWVLGSGAGPYNLAATVTGSGITGSPLVFTATAFVPIGPPDTIYVVAGSGQRGVVGTDLPVRPKVRVLDAQGRRVPGVQIRFTEGAAGGTVRGGNQTTDDNGEAEADGWTLGTAAGIQYLLIYAPNGVKGSPAVADATAVAGSPRTLAKLVGDNQVGFIGGNVVVPPAVKVSDQYGNGVAGITVTFATPTAGSSITGPTQVTNAQGIATVGSWRMAPNPGQNLLTATVTQPAGVTIAPSSVTFTATGAVIDGTRPQ